MIGLSLTRLPWFGLVLALLVMGIIFADGWRRTQVPVGHWVFEVRPLSCSYMAPDGTALRLRCTHASIYPWLVVLQLRADTAYAPQPPLMRWLKRPVVLLPDSLPENSSLTWRELLVWAHLARRQQSSS